MRLTLALAQDELNWVLELPSAVTSPLRLEAVKRSGLLRSAPDATFDGLASLGVYALGAPLAFVRVVDDATAHWSRRSVFPTMVPREQRYTRASAGT